MYARLTLLPALRQSAAVNVGQSRCAFSLRSWDVFAYDLLPNRLRLLDRSAYPQNYTEDSMEHFRVMTKLRMLSTFVCLAAVSSGQRRPIALRFQLALLGRFRTLAPLPIGCTPSGFASWMGYASQALGVLVRVGCTPCGASTPRLSTSSSLRRLTGLLREKLHLRAGFTLRCFQRLSFPDAATQLHGWRHDWYTVGPSTPVLSY